MKREKYIITFYYPEQNIKPGEQYSIYTQYILARSVEEAEEIFINKNSNRFIILETKLLIE